MLITLTHHAIGGNLPLAVNVEHVLGVERRRAIEKPPDQAPDHWYNLLLMSDGREFFIAECPDEVARLANGELEESMFAKSNRPTPWDPGILQDVPEGGE